MRWRFEIALAALAAAIGLAGCGACKSYTFRTSIDETLAKEGSRAIPISIYLAPPEKVTELEAITSAKWFLEDYDKKVNPNLLVSIKAVSGTIIPITKPTSGTVSKVFIWAGNPGAGEVTPANDPFRFIIDPAIHRQKECSFDLVVKKEGLSVMADGHELRQGVATN
jgi:hypothetical protein